MEVLVREAFGPAVSMRDAYGRALVALGAARPEVVVLSADVQNSDRSYMFEEAYPDRFFNVGIAEQALVDVAVGLAKAGKVPIANTFAFLFTTRALEQVRTHLAYGKANVKMAGAYAGLSDSYDGPTHHCITDVAILRSLPNMTVVVPADTLAIERLLPQVAAWPGPVYLRLSRNEAPQIFTDAYRPVIGQGLVLRDGADLTIVSCGMMVSRCLQAAELLAAEGIGARVVEMHTIKPLDEDLVRRSARETGAMVTVEEHSVIGGLGGAVAECLSEVGGVPLVRVGLQDRFAETGPYEALLDRYGLGVADVVTAARGALARK